MAIIVPDIEQLGLKGPILLLLDSFQLLLRDKTNSKGRQTGLLMEQVEWHVPPATCTAVKTIVSAFYVVVGSCRHHKHTPA